MRTARTGRTGRTRLLVAAGLCGVAGLTALTVWLTSAHSTDRPTTPAANPRESARSACLEAGTLYHQLVANAPAATVFSTADKAKTYADAAAAGDARWIQLDSAVQSVVHSLHTNDGNLAGVGIELLRSDCAGLGVPLPAPSH